MGVTGVRFVDPKELPNVEHKLVSSCLTFGFALMLDQLYEDGAEALRLIDANTDDVGMQSTITAMHGAPQSFGVLRTNPVCSAVSLTPRQFLDMLCQMHMVRMMMVTAPREPVTK